jgi:glutathione-regulated potassium-efflux system ancillary protein KefF
MAYITPFAPDTCENRLVRYVTGMQATNTIPSMDVDESHADTMKSSKTDIYLIAAHPNWRESRVNRLLRDAAQKLGRVHTCDLYASYPDYDIDIAAEQERLSAAQLVVWLHPIHWYSMPALMKLWVDDVLSFGWAYGGGTALAGKDVWLVASTGGSEDAYRPNGYNRYFFDAFLPPYEQTAALCGMRFLPPMLFHGAHRETAVQVAAHADIFSQRLTTYPHWSEIEDLDACIACEVPGDDRPIPTGDT